MGHRKLFFIAAVTFFLAACAGPRDLIVLLPNEDGSSSGVVVVENSKGEIITLDQPLAAARVAKGGSPEAASVSQSDVDQTFSGALAAQPPAPVSFVLYFVTGSTRLVPSSDDDLKKLFDAVAARQTVEIQVTGHTDRVGKVTDNDRLSLRRAQTIAKMLTVQGIKTSRVLAVGRGEREPLVKTADEVSESRNRRVEVIVR